MLAGSAGKSTSTAIAHGSAPRRPPDVAAGRRDPARRDRPNLVALSCRGILQSVRPEASDGQRRRHPSALITGSTSRSRLLPFSRCLRHRRYARSSRRTKRSLRPPPSRLPGRSRRRREVGPTHSPRLSRSNGLARDVGLETIEARGSSHVSAPERQHRTRQFGRRDPQRTAFMPVIRSSLCGHRHIPVRLVAGCRSG